MDKGVYHSSMKIRILFVLLLFVFSNVTEKVMAHGTEDNKTVTVTVKYNEEGGTINVNNTPLRNGDKLTVEYSSSVTITVSPNNGYCGWIGDLRLVPNRSISYSEANAGDLHHLNTNPVLFRFDDLLTDLTFNFTFHKFHEVTIDIFDVFDKAEVEEYNWTIVDGTHVPTGLYGMNLRDDGIKIEFKESEGSYLKQVLIDNVDMTNKVINNQLELDEAPKEKIGIVYGIKNGYCFVKYENEDKTGYITVNEDRTPVLIPASSQAVISFYPNNYRLKKCLQNGVDVLGKIRDGKLIIPSISENTLIQVAFGIPISCNLSCNKGGEVKLNDIPIAKESSIPVSPGTDVQISIVPQTGFYLRSVMIKNSYGPYKDFIDQVSNNILTIPSISESKDIVVNFAPLIYTVQVSHNEGGYVIVNDEFSADENNLVSVNAFTDVKVVIYHDSKYRVKQVKLGDEDVTKQLKNDILIIPSILEDKKVSVTFERIYTIKVNSSEGGRLQFIDNNGSIHNGSSSFYALTDIQVIIIPDKGYHLKQIKLGTTDVTNLVNDNKFTISSISEDREITVTFEKDVSITYAVKITYTEGGNVKLNDQTVTSGKSSTVTASTDIQLSIAPNKGFYLKQVMVGNTDMTGDVKDNLLVLPAISEDKDIKITFEKDAPTSYSFKVTYSGNGSVKVNGDIASNGSSIALPVLNSNIRISFSPDNEFYVKRVTLGSKDITDQIVDNSYTIPTLSSDLSLYVTFEKIPTYFLYIQMEGGYSSIEINNEVITSSTQVSDIKAGCSISFQTNKYYDIKKVTLGDKDITDQIQNGSYTIESMESNLTLKIEHVYKQYSLSIKLQGVDRIQVNGEEVTDGSSIITLAGFNRINIVSEHYLIKQILLGDKIVYQDKTEGTNIISTIAVVELTIDGNTELTIITKLREKRELSLKLKEAGTLASQLSEEDIRLVTDLNITGKIDQRDLAVMNRMPSLFNLNLGWATIEKYGNYPANTIPEKAFYNNKNINIFYHPQSLETIAKQAFLGSNICIFLGFVEEYITKIEEEAFKDCQNLIEVPSIYKIPVIEKGVFENCSNLSSLSTTLSNLIEVKESAFRNCKNLSVDLEPSIEKIGDYAFENVKCVNFGPVYNGEFKLSHIGTNALKGCQNESFHFADFPYLKELPSFEGCSNMSYIEFPPNVKQIPAGIFKGCTSLRDVYMNENIESIADNAFSDSKSISYLYVPTKNVPEVSANSFNDINYFTAELVVLPDYLYCYRDHPVWGKFLNIKLWGNETYRNLEAIVSEGGEVKAKGSNDTYFNEIFYAGESNSRSYLTSSRIEFIVSPKEGYSIESVFLNGENITNTLDENNTFVIPNLMVDSQIAVNFKKEKEATDIETINKTKRLYLSGFNQLTLSDFPIGTQAFVYDAGGRMIIRTTIRNNVEKVDLPGKGIYFILVDKESIKIVL